MTEQQKTYLLMLLHTLPQNLRKERLNSEIRHFGLPEDKLAIEFENVENSFNSGIANVNANQLNNLLKYIEQNGVNSTDIKRRLVFYEINHDFHDNILKFLQEYFQSDKPIDVGDLEKEFKGVQVASRDNFNEIINKGWTGDWILTPEHIQPYKVQVASMNESGPFPRGYYLNADIIDIKPIQYDGQIRFRIFINNPFIINTGNRNVKFNVNPVRYIR